MALPRVTVRFGDIMAAKKLAMKSILLQLRTDKLAIRPERSLAVFATITDLHGNVSVRKCIDFANESIVKFRWKNKWVYITNINEL